MLSSWLSSIPAQAACLEQAQANNYSRWPMLSLEVWPNPEATGSYDGEVTYLTSWLARRMAYLVSIFNNKTQTHASLTIPSAQASYGASINLTAVAPGYAQSAPAAAYFTITPTD